MYIFFLIILKKKILKLQTMHFFFCELKQYISMSNNVLYIVKELKKALDNIL